MIGGNGSFESYIYIKKKVACILPSIMTFENLDEARKALLND
jgi:hypothetical protein